MKVPYMMPVRADSLPVSKFLRQRRDASQKEHLRCLVFSEKTKLLRFCMYGMEVQDLRQT